MCLILFALDAHPRFRLVLAANRDEFFARRTEPVHRWPDLPVIGGRDLAAGGTWMGISTLDSHRLAAVTNVRDGIAQPLPDKRSRGALPVDFLTTDAPASGMCAAFVAHAGDYAPVNLLLDDGVEMHWATNHPGAAPAEATTSRVAPGLHGVSNGLLDEPWPKITRGVQALRENLEAEPTVLLNMLHDTTIADDTHLPHTGVPVAQERALSAMFVEMGDYGTRASTVVRIDHDGHGDITERRYPYGEPPRTVTIDF
ncbi:NRDE family protein [Gordonia sp. DT30]|uniref:NRDE family protein n=1 Tax=unclassified Gordonia (in: high G+C Gram-positive bacteria) TaxID=2657482 RepID=UPI003CEC3DCF